ncbi:MAG: AAA family ATPase, partial [Chloroflexi bacterium]|nr:AAA family ATPase [Chloroflexota bacterium]
PDLSSQFVQAYIGASGDTTLAEVLPFFKCYRAYVRGKVESFKMDDAYLSESDKVRALENAGRYFELAAAYAGRPALVIMAGLVGTGKTTVAEAIARRTGATVVSTDVVRKALAGVPATEHRLDGFESGMYSREFTRRTYHEAFREARRHLEQGRSVIVDATFLDPAERARARELAAEMSARFMAVECVLPEQVVRPRLEKRISEPSVSDGRWEVYVHQKATFTPLSELPDSEHVVVDTSAPWEKSVDEVIERLDP